MLSRNSRGRRVAERPQAARVVPNGTEAILYFVTGAFVGLALAKTVHSVKSDLQTDNKFLACYQNICFS
jgi:hypothetical protein